MRKKERYRNTHNEAENSKKQIAGVSDFLLIGFLFLVSLGLLLFFYLTNGHIQSPRLEILVQNETYGVYDLDMDQKISVNDTNVCEIKDGVVTMIDATCPDHTCMHQIPIDRNGGNIICLPNQVILHIIDAKDSGQDTDTVAG